MPETESNASAQVVIIDDAWLDDTQGLVLELLTPGREAPTPAKLREVFTSTVEAVRRLDLAVKEIDRLRDIAETAIAADANGCSRPYLRELLNSLINPDHN